MFATFKFYVVVLSLVAIFLFFPHSTAKKLKKLFAESGVKGKKIVSDRYNGWKDVFCEKDSVVKMTVNGKEVN